MEAVGGGRGVAGVMIVDVNQHFYPPLYQAGNQIGPPFQSLPAINNLFVPTGSDRFDLFAVAKETNIDKIGRHRIEHFFDLITMRHPRLIDQHQGSLVPPKDFGISCR